MSRVPCCVGTGKSQENVGAAFGRKHSPTTNTQRAAYYKFERAPSQNQRGKGEPNRVGFIRKVFSKGGDWSLTLILSRAVPAEQIGAQGWEAHPGSGTQNSPATSARKLPCESWAARSPLGQLGDKDGGPATARRKWPGFLFVCESQSSTVQP